MRHLSKVLLAIAMLSSMGLYAQSRNCGSMAYLQHQIDANPARLAALEAIENHTNLVMASEAVPSGVITIPVVVHVVYNNSTENISTAQIQSQIDVLNADFRRTNSDADGTWSQAADSEIEFCLATVDPNGNATTGITRTSTSVTAFGTNDNMKFNSSGGKDAWPAGEYLNMWVCDISGGILGYAQFPGGSASTDGVVIDYQYFGTIGTATSPFDLGRTTTHEVGHWLNLRHIWGGWWLLRRRLCLRHTGFGWTQLRLFNGTCQLWQHGHGPELYGLFRRRLHEPLYPRPENPHARLV